MRYIVLIISLLIAAAFVVANWAGITQETNVDLFFAERQAPIGLILVIIFGILFFVFVCTMVAQQGSALLGYRRILKDRDAQKKLAQDAEVSRVAEVKKEIEEKMMTAMAQRKQEIEALEGRLAKAAEAQLSSLKATVSQVKVSNTELAESVKAALQTMDDKVTKALISANHVAHAIGVQNGAQAQTQQIAAPAAKEALTSDIPAQPQAEEPKEENK